LLTSNVANDFRMPKVYRMLTERYGRSVPNGAERGSCGLLSLLSNQPILFIN